MLLMSHAVSGCCLPREIVATSGVCRDPVGYLQCQPQTPGQGENGLQATIECEVALGHQVCANFIHDPRA